MALKEQYMVKTVEDNVDLELEADPGEAFLIKDIHIYNPATNYITLRTQKVSVGYFRVGGTLGNHLHEPIKDEHKKTLLGYLADLGVFKGLPVDEGEKFTITGAKQSGARQTVVYEIYDPADISNTMENGSKADTYVYINYGRLPGAVTSGGETEYTVSQNPAEFPDFPFGANVPAKTEIDLIGILASDYFAGTGTSGQGSYTKYLKLIKERDVLFDEDRQGIPLDAEPKADTTDLIGEGYSLIGNYSDADLRSPWILPSPITFLPGEELYVGLVHEAKAVAGSIAVDETEIGFIQRVRRV